MMVSLERKPVPMKPVLPSHHPMQSWNSRKIMLFMGGGEGLGMYDYEESPTSASVTKDSWPWF